MELKIWTDGVQRVVCGITESTTCRDVIVAIAQATGRTGHFRLIEKWRGSERSLDPRDCPLRTLYRVGDCHGDVEFKLIYGGASQTTWSQKRSIRSSQHSVREGHVQTGTNLKKSLSVSCCQTSKLSVSRRVPNVPHHRVPSSLDSSGHSSLTTDSSTTCHLQSSTDLQLTDSARTSGAAASPRSASNISTNQLHASATVDSGKTVSVQSTRRLPCVGNSSVGIISKTSTKKESLVARSSSDSLSSSSGEFVPSTRLATNVEAGRSEKYPTREKCSSQTQADPLSSEALKLSSAGTSSREPSTDTAEREQLVEELLRQQGELAGREIELKTLQSEMSLAEMDRASATKNLESLAERLRSLDEREAELDEELQELELVSWEDKLVLETQKNTKLQAEVASLQSTMSQTDVEVERHKQKIEQLNADVERETELHQAETKKKKKRHDEEVRELETRLAEEKAESQSLDKEFKCVKRDLKLSADQLSSKLSELSRLELHLKDVNMKQLSETAKTSTSKGVGVFEKSSRPGSAREFARGPLKIKNTNESVGYIV